MAKYRRFDSWLWPDRIISKRESREMREEHNALLNSHAALLEACQQIVWKLSHNTSPSGRGDDCRPGTIDRRDITVKLAEAAIAKAIGQD